MQIQKEDCNLRSAVYKHESIPHRFKIGSNDALWLVLNWYLLHCFRFLFANFNFVQCNHVIRADHKVEVIAETKAKC